jgi:hypothetical protein
MPTFRCGSVFPCWAALAPVALALCLPAASQSLPARAQALLNQARAANPQRFQYALDQGATVLPTSDGRSFYLLWYPAGVSGRNQPLIATLHGSTSWAFDEFFLWHPEASKAGYGMLALQWWFGAGEGVDDYYTPAALHAELRAALGRQGNREGSALLHGFSRGASNIYGVAALDRQSKDRFYAMFLANSGGASPDFPANSAVSRGDFGYNAFSGAYWMMFCGGQDPNPDRDGCPAMHRTSDWVGLYGGVTDLFIEDAGAGHGGFHQTPAHIQSALAAFGRNLAMRAPFALTDTVWEVRRDPQFEIPNASIPNVGLVGDEVRLVVGTQSGPRLYRSGNGSNASSPELLPGLGTALSGTGYGSGEVIPRQDRDGNPLLYVLGLAPPGVNRSALFRLSGAAGTYVLSPRSAVFEGAPDDAQFIGVPDLTPTSDGRLRLIYVARGAARGNSRTAVSADAGATFTAEFNNPFGDLAIPNPKATDTNVDPAVLKLARGEYLAVTMRAARLYLFTSVDGRTFVPSDRPPIEPPDLWPGATGLFDPTLVRLPDGRIFLYATAGADPGSASSVVRAEIVRHLPALRGAGN